MAVPPAQAQSAPGKPNLQRTGVGDQSATLRWIAAGTGNGTTYRLEYKQSTTTDWTGASHETTNHPTIFTTVSGLAQHSAYDFRVRATNSAGDSPWSDIVKVAGRPGPLTALTATPALNNVAVTLSWTAPANDGGKPITGYSVQWRPDSNNNWGTDGAAGTKPVAAGATSVDITAADGLQPSTTYNFRYSAGNADRRSFWTPGAGEVEATTGVDPAGPPGQPLNARAAAQSSTDIKFDWDAPAAGSGGTFDLYQIQSREEGATDWNAVGGTTSNTRTLGGLHPGTTYEFRVQACKASPQDNCGPWSDTASATTHYIPPDEPLNFMASALNNDNQGTDRLTWDPPTNTGVTGYLLRRRVAGQTSWQPEITVTGTQHDFAKEANTSGSAYEYGLKATNATGDSALLTATVAGRPDTISDLSATASTTDVAVALSWTAPSNTGGKALTQYRVEWRVDATGDWNDHPATGNTAASGSATSFTVNQGHGIQPNTVYDFRIRADNEDRVSFYSNTAQANQATLNPATTISVADVSASEGDSLPFDISLDVALSGNLTISYGTTQAGTAGTDDFIPITVSSAFLLSGLTTFDIPIGTTQDTIDEGNETVKFEFNVLSGPAVTVGQRVATGTILDDDDAAAAPGALRATASVGEVELTWAPPDPGMLNGSPASINGYQYRLTTTAGDYSSATWENAGSASPFTVRNLDLDTTYYFQVRAVTGVTTANGEPAGAASAEVSATTPDVSATISSPSSLSERTLNGAQVTVDLVGTEYSGSLDASDFGLQGVGGLSVASVNRASDTRAVLTLSFSGNFVTDVQLRVVVDGSAHTSSSTSLTTAEVTVTPAQTPARVSGVGAEPGPASLTVTWRAVDHADGYRVSVRRSADASDVTIRDVAGGSTNRAGISGLLGDTAYDVRVRALSDFAQEGAWSNPITATTLPGHAIVSATDPSPLTERNLDGATLTVDLLPGIYDPWAPRLDRATVTASGVPGVTISDVTRVSDERMVVTLASDDTDFDADRTLRVEFYGAHTSIETITAVADVKAVVETAPGRVQNVRVRPAPLRLLVTWDPVPDATGYRVEFQDPGANWWYTYLPEVRVPRRTIGALSPDTTYKVRVYAVKTRAPNGPYSAEMSGTTPAFGAMLTSTDPSPLHEGNLHGARLTVDLMGVEWERLVEGRYYRAQLGRKIDCSWARYSWECYPFNVNRSVVVTGIERVSLTRAVVSLRARNVDLQGNGLWIRFPDDLHTNYRGESDFIVLQVIAPDVDDFVTLQNNRASVTVSESDLDVLEGGDATYTVVLDGQPTGNVVITASSDNGDVTTQPASLTFTRDNWQTAQTVTVRASHDDDAVDDAATVSHTVSGADGYAGIDVASVSVSVSDDDTASVTVSESTLDLNEGESASYTVVLDTQPVGNVLISVLASTGISAQPTGLTFTPDNWQTPQTVTVSAAHDDDTDDGTGWIIHSNGAGPDSGYAGVPVGNVIVDIIDDDEAQAQAAQQEPEPEPEPEPGSVTVSASSLGVREGDDGATYTVVLDVEPTANVTITVSSDNGDVTAEPASLTFTTGNWQSAQTVTVSAGEDSDREDELAIVSHGASGGNYDGVTVGFVTVIVTDDDTTVEALRDFYEAADGANWTNSGNWLSSRPLAEWHGVTVNEDGEVTHLALRDNNLVGTLAPELGKLERLEVVSLDRNSLGGELPVELGDLSNLTRLALNRNSLTGAIPSELGSLSNLSIIGLARNQLSGSLPVSLGNLTGLTRLSLHDNTGLSGALPSGFTGLADLERLAIANTGLCAPDDEGFTAWLDGVADKPGGVATCE